MVISLPLLPLMNFSDRRGPSSPSAESPPSAMTAQGKRELPGLLGHGDDLGLHEIELERRGLADHHLLALVVLLEGLVDGQDAHVAQHGVGSPGARFRQSCGSG